MTSITKPWLLVAAASAMAITPSLADPFSHTDGNLLLGFQATGGTGASQNVFISLGAATGFRDNGNQGTLANIGATLTAVYGSNWYSRTDLYFGVIGNLSAKPNSGIGSAAAVNGDPSRTFYLSSAAATPGAGSLIAAATYGGSALGAAGTNLNGMENMLRGVDNGVIGGLSAQPDGSGIIDQTNQDHATAWNNGWTRWNPTPGAAFEVFSGGIQQNFGKGGAATYADVQRVLSTNTGASPVGVIGGGTYETTISISSAGVVSSLTSTAPSSGFATWIGTFNPPLTNPAEREPAADPDHDGIENLMEFVLNGNPTVSGQAVLPVLNAAGSDFVFGFTRRADSAGDVNQVFEYSTDLANWTAKAPITIPSTPGTVGYVTVGASTGTAPNQVQVVTITVPKTGETKLFGRLKVSK